MGLAKHQKERRENLIKAAQRKLALPAFANQVDWPNVHTRDVERFLRKVDAAEKRARKSRLKFDGDAGPWIR